MLTTFGWKAAIAVLVNGAAVSVLFCQQLGGTQIAEASKRAAIPFAIMMVSSVILFGIMAFAHHPALFLARLLFFMGIHLPRPDRQYVSRTASAASLFPERPAAPRVQPHKHCSTLRLQQSNYYGVTAQL